MVREGRRLRLTLTYVVEQHELTSQFPTRKWPH